MDGDETIDIQMPDEIAKAEWLPLRKLKGFAFTDIGRNICRILVNEDKINSGEIDIKQMRVGDLLRDGAFSF